MDASVFAELISSSSPQPPLDGSAGTTLNDLYAQTFTVALSCVLILVAIGWLWPASKPFAQLELLWTVAPREAERARIWRLILPQDALEYSEAGTVPGAAAQAERSPMVPASVVQRVTDTVPSVARLLSPDPRRLRERQQAWETSWTFQPKSEAARDCTPLLVFINRASGGRQGPCSEA